MNRGVLIGIGLVLGLALGCAAGAYFLGGSGAAVVIDAPRAKASPAVSPAAGSPAESPAPRPLASASFTSSSQALLDDLTPPETESPPEEEAAPEGTGVITGSVFSDRGTPIASALVRVMRRAENEDAPARTKPGDIESDDLRESARRWLESEERQRRQRREGRTDGAGAYSVGGLADGLYSVQVLAEGYQVAPIEGMNAWQVRPGGRVDFVATSMVRVLADVRLPDGTSPERATIVNVHRGWRRGESPGGGQRWTKEDREIRLAPGVHQLAAIAGKDRELCSTPVHVLVEPSKTPPPIRFDVGGFTAIRGRFLLPPEFESGRFSVHLLKCDPGTPDDQKLINNGQQFWLNPGDEPRYSYGELPAGTYRIGLQVDNRGLVWSEIVTLVDGVLLEKDIPVPPGTSTGGVTVRVLGPEGKLLRNINLWITALPAPGSSQSTNAKSNRRNEAAGQWNLRRRRDGTWVAEKSATAATDIPAAAVARVNALGSRSVALPGSGNGEVEIAFDEPALLEVLVPGAEDPQRRPLFSVALRTRDGRTVGNEGWDEWGGNNVRPKDGRCTFGPLQPGAYDVVLLARGRWNTGPNAPLIPVDVRSGINSITVTPPSLHKLTLSFAPDAGVTRAGIGVAEEGEDVRWFDQIEVDSSGLANFEGLLAGDYRVYAQTREGRRTMDVRVPSGGVVPFEAAAERSLKVRRADTGSYIEQAGLRVGDFIIGVNGEAFDGVKPASTVLNGLMMARRENTLMIRRGQHTVEVPVDAARFLEEHQKQRAIEGFNR